jgi:uncharacterized membrane protein YidH (DUF202 family)
MMMSAAMAYQATYGCTSLFQALYFYRIAAHMNWGGASTVSSRTISVHQAREGQPMGTTDQSSQDPAGSEPVNKPRPSEREIKALIAWQRSLMPFMMLTLAVVAIVFFYGTFQNYNALTRTISHEDREIGQAIEAAIRINDDIGFTDWYVRSELESRALSGRQRQYSALLQSRLWTRMMGFLAGMVALMAGAVFVLGKLEAEFDGRSSGTQGNWSMKTNSPGLVLVVAGVVLMITALTITVDVRTENRLTYMPAFVQTPVPPSGSAKASPNPDTQKVGDKSGK